MFAAAAALRCFELDAVSLLRSLETAVAGATSATCHPPPLPSPKP
jgi:hypothetical protein